MSEPRIDRSVKLSKAGIEAIAELAEAEQRTWSAMLRILLSEALTARQKAGKR